MTNLKRLLAIRKHNKAKTSGFEYEMKVIKDGNSHFRILDEMPHIVFEHWFTSADGVPVHSICTRNFDSELDGEANNTCQVCEVVKNAWSIWNEPDEYSDEELYQAGVIIGKKTDKGKGFASSWTAKQFAYLNVIDRDSNWCVDNKHSKVLSKSEKQGGISSGDKGQFDELIDLADEYGEWTDYDTRMKKQGKKLDTTYRVYKGDEVELTEEEKAYELYSFNELLKPTPADVIKRWLEVGVKGNAKESSKEEAEAAPEPKKAASKKTLGKKPVDAVEEEAPEPKKASAKKTKAKLSLKAKEEPEPEPEPTPDPDVEMAECPECSTMIPSESSQCPQCGTEFE